ncbi:hypothetical protein [endosymbiont GvMRE of Glomus versiforme]|nr:hypothetical protein [endosymbiont GvMRE of Glomus versiforme]RHZ36391.1 hypothetical protein GvMRE_Ic1g85 [endosymbiont GvMRE of Glomus versiforme]
MFNLNTQPLITKIDEFTQTQQQTLACLQAIQATLNQIEKHLKEK